MKKLFEWVGRVVIYGLLLSGLGLAVYLFGPSLWERVQPTPQFTLAHPHTIEVVRSFANEQCDGEQSDVCRGYHRFLERRCARSQATACAYWGISLLDGRHIDAAVDQAFAALETACDGGIALGCNNAGVILLDHRNQPASANRLFEQACDLDYASACSNLSVSFRTGRAVVQDYQRSIALSERACALGGRAGCMQAGDARTNGNEMMFAFQPNVPEQAAAAYEAACDLESANGCRRLATIYEEGFGREVSFSRAADLYDQACAMGNDMACSDRVRMRYHGVGEDPRPETALQEYQQQCEDENFSSCMRLMELFYRGEIDGTETVYGLEDLADAVVELCWENYASACFIAAENYEAGRGVEV